MAITLDAALAAYFKAEILGANLRASECAGSKSAVCIDYAAGLSDSYLILGHLARALEFRRLFHGYYSIGFEAWLPGILTGPPKGYEVATRFGCTIKRYGYRVIVHVSDVDILNEALSLMLGTRNRLTLTGYGYIYGRADYEPGLKVSQRAPCDISVVCLE